MTIKTIRLIALVWPLVAFTIALLDRQGELTWLWGGIAGGVLFSRFLEWRMAREAVPH